MVPVLMTALSPEILPFTVAVYPAAFSKPAAENNKVTNAKATVTAWGIAAVSFFVFSKGFAPDGESPIDHPTYRRLWSH